MKSVLEGERFILKLDSGEGLMYEVTNSLINPFQLVKTLSKKEVKENENMS